MSRENVDDLLARLDDIFDGEQDYIDQQLARGDQSQSYHGEQMPRCRWCREEWHELPITKVMREMRNGSYGRDEFGYPIIDPDYRYDEDDSDWVCPGSGFYGPETPNKSWRLPRGSAHPFRTSMDSSGMGASSEARRWRFVPPFTDWDVQLETQWLLRSDHPGVEDHVRHVATFRFEGFTRPPEEARSNGMHPFWSGVHMLTVRDNELLCLMKPIQFEYEDMCLHWDNPMERYMGRDPDWVEFLTTYPIESHSWCSGKWQLMPPPEPGVGLATIHGEAAIDTIVDEAHTIPTEELHAYIERASQRIAEAPSSQAAVHSSGRAPILYFSTAVPEGVADGVEDGASTGEGET